MNVLVVGSGGREHALVWKISQSNRVDRVFCAPGNAGTESEAENVDIAADDIPALVEFAKQNSIALVVVGPEKPLCDGLVDALDQAGIRAFGPAKNAAELEGSKAFCKNVLRRAAVPTADFNIFQNPEDAERFVSERYEETPENVPLVVKADGLAAGKGVIVCSNRDEVFTAIDQIGRQMQFGKAGRQIVLEERLTGVEASVLAITDGKTIVTLPAAQDHKPAWDGDKGPNTGGMGAYCPTPLVDEKMFHWIEENVLLPTVHTMKRSRTPFHGLLYAGLMVTPQGPKVLEYNVRFGDPECQPLLFRLKSDLFELLMAAAEGNLADVPSLQWDERTAVCVVMASEGYPGAYEKGRVIRGLEEAAKVPDTKVFHAGTRRDAAGIVTAGGRVLGVTAMGNSVANARLQAYKAVKCIRWDGAWCRKDIGDKALGVPSA
ncbi:MAG: phosphoribosylamine--glycine ligase [Planctomycetaceae bacterium]|nr:phosphoribosylamine--glycine ligase [Planctomycetaceae bacterium]MCP4464308.1 phosphoribosylamine--glycine ligase [Planctomycetaceae bacterium]MDG1806659.1 phosphoribosylamine--glycine ligase [Pirellulaceae bacterium]MDG2103698.1 phosphoribosylamine--glycine ligase [Pirellulaceae bacterium]